MASLNAVIIPAKVLKNGRHKIRISVAHNGETRYLVTNLFIDSAKEFKNGSVIKRHDAAMLNTKIRGVLQHYQDIINDIDYVNGLSCPELICAIKNYSFGERRTLASISEEYIANSNIKPRTAYIYTHIWSTISRYISEEMLASQLTYGHIMKIEKSLRKDGLRDSSVLNIMTYLNTLTKYAKRCGYAEYKLDPFDGYKFPPQKVRQCWLSVEEIRAIRDAKVDGTVEACRDIFMLSYYLGGINITDLTDINFNKHSNTIKYVRKKTENRPKMNKYVEFEIPEEAKVIINKYKSPITGQITIGMTPRDRRLNTFFTRNFPKLAAAAGIDHLIYYCARKSFSQHAFQLGISTSVIDYILGHKVDKVSTALYSYIRVTQEMATAAVRKVLDHLKEV